MCVCCVHLIFSSFLSLCVCVCPSMSSYIVVVGHRCLLFFSYMYEYACATHITMKTMFRLIDDLCQVKAALIFMANHSRYVPRNFTIDFAFRIFFPFYPSNTLFVAHVILMFGAVASFLRLLLLLLVAVVVVVPVCTSGLFTIIPHTKRIKNQIWSFIVQKVNFPRAREEGVENL